MPHHNIAVLALAARALGPTLCERLVFVGGSIAGLLITDPAVADIRVTVDVDAVVEAATLVDFYRIEESLPPRGFIRDSASDVICRWRHPKTGIVLDLMPTEPSVLGFANRWYPEAIRSAVSIILESELSIQVIAAPVFIATKLEAFRDRGRGDLLLSHDFEDLIAVIDGRPEIVVEWAEALPELRQVAGSMLAEIAAGPWFEATLEGLVREEGRARVVQQRLTLMLAG